MKYIFIVFAIIFSCFFNVKGNDVKVEVRKVGDRTFTYHIEKNDTIIIEKRDFAGVEYFQINKGNIYGCMDLNNNVIIPLSKGYTVAYPQKLNDKYPVTYQVKKDGFDGVCDASGNEIISPSQKYSSVVYQINSDGVHYFEVMKDGKSGACDMSGKEVVSTNYYSIIYDAEGFLVMDSENSNFRKTGVMLNSYGIASKDAVNRQKQVEDDGFVWYKLYKNGVFGAESVNGKTLIPLSRNYTSIYYWKRKDGKKGYFECVIGDKEGICTIDGVEIIPPKYAGIIFLENGGFSVQKKAKSKYQEVNIFLADNGLVKKEESTKQRYVASNNHSSHSHNHNHSHNANSGKTSKSHRIQDMNGYTDIIPQGNGTTLMITHQVCFLCKGTRICSVCGGRGGIIHPYLGSYIACTNCMSSGICKYCRGTGEQVFKSVVDNQGNGYNVDMNGNFVSTGGLGTGSSSGTSKNKSNSSSSRRRNDYIEVIEYSPNYTGEDNSEWCDICKKVSPAHKHIKK